LSENLGLAIAVQVNELDPRFFSEDSRLTFGHVIQIGLQFQLPHYDAR